MRGKHIELFLVEGVPGGITTAEIAGWTGHVLAGPRSDLGDVLKRPEAKRRRRPLPARRRRGRGGRRALLHRAHGELHQPVPRPLGEEGVVQYPPCCEGTCHWRRRVP